MMNEQHWYEEQKQQHFSDADHKSNRARTVSLSTLIVCMLITGLLGGAAGGVVSYGTQQRQLQAIQQQMAALETSQVSGLDAPAQEVGANASTPSANSNLIPTVAPSSDGTYTKAQIIEFCAPSIVGIDVMVPGSGWYGDTMQSGSGSGVIISQDGYIITNNHVVSGATDIKVYLYDDTEYTATLIGTDAKTDLAVIKIDAQGLRAAQLGDSGSLLVGEDVLAIGNPLGELRGTATSGMISAISRTINIEGQGMTLLQTDAAINPGNSGGGLFNMQGELVGIVNAKVASSSTEGLGFAIPVDDAKAVVSDLIDLGYVSGRAYLGVVMNNVQVPNNSSDNGSRTPGGFGLKDYFGFFGGNQSYTIRVEIVELVSGGAAEKAGLQVGDYILQVDDTEITNTSHLAIVIREYNAGDMATIKVERNGQEINIPITFDENKPEKQS